MTFTETFELQPLAPFSLKLSAQIFAGLNPAVRCFEDGVFSQVLRVNGNLVLAKITSKGTVENPELQIKLASNQPITAQTKQSAKEAIEYIFNLHLDLKTIYNQAEKDAVMHKIILQLAGFKYPTTLTAFESLVDSIVEQQISIKIARTIEERLAQKFGEKLEINGAYYHTFPTAHNLADASISEIRACGLSQRKAEYIYGAAKAATTGDLDLEAMKTNPDINSVVAELDALKGIGVWTAELTIFRGMQRLDVLPADDFGIRRVISKYYCGGKPIKAADAREVAKLWSKWRGLAAFYLLAAEANGVVV
ncbi:DNA-3-methyladenine glycosylase 2 family protein [Candidatus Bathyarchaeota archaeon]|nr:DNA-3-methyladenine glycosylase 2 family protein [Candidatus Bathyarchaeota archaeon]